MARPLGTMLILVLAAALAGCASVAPPPHAGMAEQPAVEPPTAGAVLTSAAAPAETTGGPALDGSHLVADPVEASRVVVSYFHPTIRCETCLKIEALTERALREAFADELASGRLEWHVMDFDYVVTLCDGAKEACPYFPAGVRVVHRGFEDPPKPAAGARSEQEALGHYRRVRDEIRAFVKTLPAGFETTPERDES